MLFVLLLGCIFVLFVPFVIFVIFVPFVLFVLFVRVKSFCKKNKKFKTALITSFTLLLNSSYYKHEYFSIITIFFSYHNLFQLSQSFSVITIFFITIFLIKVFFITIFFNYHYLFYHNLFESLYNS